jgi:hypothetical protein
MWSAIISAVSTVFKGWVDVKKSKQEAEAAYHRQALKGEQDWDIKAMEAAKYSWKDELITLIWFAPLVVAWFDPDRAMKWIQFVSELPLFYQIGMFGIMAASFGLRWFFKQQGLKLRK